MDPRVAGLQARLATAAGFRDLVNAMRGVAAARAQQARQRIAGVDAFARAVADAMAQALPLLPESVTDAPAGEPLRLVFCPEQGLNGGLTERVMDAVPPPVHAPVMLIGAQGLRLAHARGRRVEWHAPLISQAHAVVAASDELHAALAETQLRCRAEVVEMIHPAVDGHRITIQHRRLLPLDWTELRAPGSRAGGTGAARPPQHPPRIHLPPATLVTALAREYVSARLVQAMLHAHAAENLARLQAMAAAHENVERLIDDLHADERQWRQAAITEEIIELAAGLRGLGTRR